MNDTVTAETTELKFITCSKYDTLIKSDTVGTMQNVRATKNDGAML
jgi:hypothetical protein